MPGIAVIGLQWGDEGKGKASAYLAREASLAVRFNGGANAGHTVTFEKGSLSLHMLPAATVSTGKAAIGPGVYLDLEELFRDQEKLEAVKERIDVTISPRAHLVTPLNKILDAKFEEVRGGKQIGTTMKGIGPTAIHKYGRFGLRLSDALEPETLMALIDTWTKIWGGLVKIDARAIADLIGGLVERARPLIGDVTSLIKNHLSMGGAVIFEGAQGTMLDIDHGTYPYVTSSHTVAAAASLGSGVGLRTVDKVVGVCKAYTTRVGAGPFPTELRGEVADSLRERGGEYGATTGRPRRIGWLDIPQLRYACQLNDADEIFLTRIDTLSGQNKVGLCIEYEGEEGSYPETVQQLQRVKPKIVEYEGWPSIDENSRLVLRREGYGALHKHARRFIESIEDELGIPVKYIGIGPRIDDVIEK